MSTRASVFESVQFGVEVTPGTQVPANKRLQSFDLDCDPQIPTRAVQPQGWKATTDLVTEKEWTKAALKGDLCFNTLPYLLSGLLCQPVISTPAGNGVWTFDLGTSSGGNYKTTFNAVSSANIAQAANAAAIQAAMEAMSTVGTGNVLVSKVGSVVTVTFRAALERTPLALTIDATGLTGPGAPYTITPASTAPSSTRRWKFLPNITGPDVLTSFTVEKGSSVGAESFGFGVFDAMDFDFNLKSAAVKGEMLGQKMTDGIAMTGGPTDIPVKAVSPDSLDVYVGSSVLGLTKLQNCFKSMWGVKDRVKPKFTQNTDFPSFSDIVEGKFNQSAQIVIEQDATANGFMADLRAKTQKFGRIVMTGGTIESGYAYRVQITFPFKFKQPKRGDNDGVYSGTYDLEPTYVSSFGGAIEVVVDTGYAAL